jgi:hypothetical protein
MKLSILERTNDTRPDQACTIERDGATLRVAQSASHVRSWEPVVIRGGEGRAEPDAGTPGGVQIKAEITAKRFVGNQVSQDRYEATLQALDGSPSSLISALSAACAGIEEFRAVNGSDERIILQISLIR